MVLSALPIDPKNMDQSINPGDSFYHYVNGGWLKSTTIPAQFPSISTFRELDELSKENLRMIFESLKDEPVGSNLIAEFFASAMDVDNVNAQGFEPLKPLLAKIDSIQSLGQAMEFTAVLHQHLLAAPLFDTYPIPDSKNSEWVVFRLGQSTLGLPDRDYYFDESKLEKCKLYQTHIANLFKLIASSDPEGWAAKIFTFETELAEISLKRQDLRDPIKTYNKLQLKDLKKLTPSLNWDSYFETIQLKEPGDLNVENVEYFSKLDQLLSKTQLETLKAYFKYHLLIGSSPYLSDAFVNEHFAFKETALNGTLEIQPRWKRCIAHVSDLLRDLVSQLYVAKHFSAESKQSAFEMVQYIIKQFEHRIKTVDWMQEETRLKALNKLSKFRVKIGYPDKWTDYSNLSLTRTKSYFENYLAAAKFKFDYEISHVNKAVDKSKWEMPPYMVNAYFHPMLNEIVFPAAILQPPFFFPPTAEFPYGHPAMNFGGIGSVIAHEISHGYDDQGRQFDANGNLVDWWQEEDAKNFKERAKLIVEQFNQYEILGKKVNGELTQGENIADLGGVSVSFAAFVSYLESHQVQDMEGFNAKQQFFISWAQIWRNLYRDDALLQRLVVDVHSPGEFRVDGPLANVPEFHDAFGIRKGQRMYVDETKRVSIW